MPEGREGQVRVKTSDGWKWVDPPTPEYAITAAGTVCLWCGAVIADRSKHDDFHQRVGDIPAQDGSGL